MAVIKYLHSKIYCGNRDKANGCFFGSKSFKKTVGIVVVCLANYKIPQKLYGVKPCDIDYKNNI